MYLRISIISILLGLYSFSILGERVYRIEDGKVVIEKDTGQPGLRDVVAPDESSRLRQNALEEKLKKGKELERSKLNLPKLKLQGRVAKPRMPFSKLEPSLVDVHAYDEKFGSEQGRWKLRQEARKSIWQLKP